MADIATAACVTKGSLTDPASRRDVRLLCFRSLATGPDWVAGRVTAAGPEQWAGPVPGRNPAVQSTGRWILA